MTWQTYKAHWYPVSLLLIYYLCAHSGKVMLICVIIFFDGLNLLADRIYYGSSVLQAISFKLLNEIIFPPSEHEKTIISQPTDKRTTT